MAQEAPGLARYRRFLRRLAQLVAGLAIAASGLFLMRGKGFPAFLALAMGGLLLLIAYGYVQEARERER
ncbi:MAG: hypothetical protein HC813_04065 [Planctomycetes bacterium]|nr:hypothetical protein [Planctomycetota bacterium]